MTATTDEKQQQQVAHKLLLKYRHAFSVYDVSPHKNCMSCPKNNTLVWERNKDTLESNDEKEVQLCDMKIVYYCCL